ncbi:MAG: sulfide/dihydroorotate dehydrogenase-like FAD/NAD-binding protein [Erysipelotrichaceae bacterium]|nr:sulfide/dihydroorotate dehydrogenase-like FAD/NAD-binding protein [Erysipelotrichaceae bacterium]
MYLIEDKKRLNPTVTQMDIVAPLIAKKARPGQFIILRVDEEGERIPLTIAGCDPLKGTVKIIFQIVGSTTLKLDKKEKGEYIEDFVGPLGVATETNNIKKVCIIGGGVGCAIALPIAEEFHRLNAEVTTIIGFRNKDLVILEDEFRNCSDRMILMTDDGSYGEKGNVTVPLKEMLEKGEMPDRIFAIGPLVMMKFTTLTAKPFNVPVTVSMNPIMIDGTGMCGCCRLTLDQDGKKIIKFACIDGPDFNGYEVDFDEVMSRNRMYDEFERHAYEKTCNLFKQEV